METISIIIGGHNLSEHAMELISSRKGLSLENFKKSIPKYYNGFRDKAPKNVIMYRSDQVIIDTIVRLKNNAFRNTWYKPSIAMVDKKFMDFIDIIDCEGHENISIDFTNYTIKTIQQINNDPSLNNDQKHKLINQLCDVNYDLADFVKYLDY